MRQNNPAFRLRSHCSDHSSVVLSFLFLFLYSCSPLALMHHSLTLLLSLQLCTFIQLSLAFIRFLLWPWLHGTRLGPALELPPALVLVVPAAPLALLPAHPGMSRTILSLREPTAFSTLNDRPASWRHPDRHVLILVNFQDLADLSSRTQQLPDNADLLDAECRVHLDAIDETSLFTWCRQFDHRVAIQTPIGNLCHLIISTRFETLGTSASLALLWNYGPLIIGEILFNLLLTRPLPRPWIHGYLAGANFSIPRLHGKPSPGAHGGPLPGTYPVIATSLESFCLDDTATG